MVNYHKYKAIRTEVDGIWFASKKEDKGQMSFLDECDGMCGV